MPLPGDPRDRDDTSELTSAKSRSRRSLLLILVAVAAFVIARQTGMFGPTVDTQALATVDSAALIAELRAAGPLLGEGKPGRRCRHGRVLRLSLPALPARRADRPGVGRERYQSLCDPGRIPVLGSESELAAKFALAAARQDAYDVYHRALMFSTIEWTSDALAELGASLDLDPDKLREDAQSAEISSLLAAYKAAGRNAQISGTPAFVTGSLLLVGAADEVTLKEMIRQTREESGQTP